MNKFDSKEFERKQIEKLKQEQLIKSIGSRKELELKALIEATKKSKSKSQEDIIKIKNQIIQAELNKEKQKSYNEIKRKIENIRDVEKQAEQMERRKELKEQKRKEESERIVKGITKKVEDKRRNEEILNVFEKHISPERAKIIEKESYDIIEQWKKELENENKPYDEIFKQLEKEFREEEEERKNSHTVKSIVKNNRKKLATTETEKRKLKYDKNKELNERWQMIKAKRQEEEKIKRGQEILDKARGTKFKKQFKSFIEKINPFKTKRGVQAYQKNIEEYNMEFGNNSRSSKVDIKIQSAQEKKLTPSQYLFGPYYQKAYINHQKAQKDAQDNANVEPIFEPKIP